MRLFTYGDSWTEGVGGNNIEEIITDIPEEKTFIRHKYCWPKHLSDLLECDFQNHGVCGFSNKAIFDTIHDNLKNGIINQDDFVVIMCSSSLRDPLPFFANENDIFFWSKRYKSKNHILKRIFGRDNSELSNFNRIEKDYRDYYVTNLYTDTYYDIVNQNYILHLQFMFKQMGIRYVFCDAFDTMVNDNIIDNVNKTNLINESHYWGFKNKTMADLLVDTKRRDVWEDGYHWSDNYVNKHPNNNGYKLISDELYKFIIDNNILMQNKFKNSYLI